MVTWKTPSSRAFVPLQEPVGVLASYVPPRANAGMKRNECGCTQPLFRVGHDHGINKRPIKYWRILNKECLKIKYWKYVQVLAARENQADWKILAARENQAD
jgi:hypothetical protein